MSSIPFIKPPRDRFIDRIIAAMDDYDKDVYFISADMGTESLDILRERYPERFIYTGIAEQNTINVAAGLASRGKKVFVIGMASFITARCYDQIRYSLALMKLPACIMGIGVGFGYEDAGPAHYTTDDIGLMRLIHGMNIYTITDGVQAERAAEDFLSNPKLTYVRMERKILPDIEMKDMDFKMGFHYINKTDNYDKVLLTCGYTRKIGQEITGEIDISHIELIRNTDTCFDQIDIFTMLPSILGELVKYKKIIVIEEQSYPGSTASLIMENANLQEWNPKVWFFGAPNSYVFENGGRDHIHGLCGMDSEWIIDRIKTCP